MKSSMDHMKEYLDILKPEELRNLANEINLTELLEQWDSLSEEEQLNIFLHLDLETKVALFNLLPSSEQQRLIKLLSVENTKLLLSEMDPDDLVDFIQAVSGSIRKAVWENLSDEAKKEALFLLRFDDDDAAGLMTPRYLTIRATITVSQALKFIRKSSNEVETVYYIYVVDNLQRLAGVVSLREILSAQDTDTIQSIMTANPLTVREETDQEEVAKILETNDLIALPVVDKNERILGIITVDDVIDVIREEQTEDVYKMGAMNGSPDAYLETSVMQMVRKRIPWLIILLLLGTVTTNVLNSYEGMIIGATFLILFLPVITQTGGNASNQSSTLIIRGLATNEIHFRDLGKVLIKEIFVGIIIGAGTGLVILVRSHFLPPGIQLFPAIAIAIALSLVVIFANFFGALAPLVIHRLGLDPTVMSGPLMSTVIDVCGITIYFETAKLLLGL